MAFVSDTLPCLLTAELPRSSTEKARQGSLGVEVWRYHPRETGHKPKKLGCSHKPVSLLLSSPIQFELALSWWNRFGTALAPFQRRQNIRPSQCKSWRGILASAISGELLRITDQRAACVHAIPYTAASKLVTFSATKWLGQNNPLVLRECISHFENYQCPLNSILKIIIRDQSSCQTFNSRMMIQPHECKRAAAYVVLWGVAVLPTSLVRGYLKDFQHHSKNQNRWELKITTKKSFQISPRA
jgi:hypothetical protein